MSRQSGTGVGLTRAFAAGNWSHQPGIRDLRRYFPILGKPASVVSRLRPSGSASAAQFLFKGPTRAYYSNTKTYRGRWTTSPAAESGMPGRPIPMVHSARPRKILLWVRRALMLFCLAVPLSVPATGQGRSAAPAVGSGKLFSQRLLGPPAAFNRASDSSISPAPMGCLRIPSTRSCKTATASCGLAHRAD